MSTKSRIGFVSTRFAGTDGVSLETAKWVKVLQNFGHECFFFAGELEWPRDQSYSVPEAHFNHPDIRALNIDLFDDYHRDPGTSHRVRTLQDHLKIHLHKFLREFEPQVLIVENALSLPMNIPLGLAITELIAETCVPTIAHHHDFAWERTRYAVGAADDYLRAAFPPTLDQVYHVVINSYAERNLALRAGVSSMIIPNVMDFETPPCGPDDYSRSLRDELGIRPGEYMILQPTRIVPRKGIEKAIELIRRLDMDAVLVIPHRSGDEGPAYQEYLRQYAGLLNVRVLFSADRFAPHRSTARNGEKIYALSDAYEQCDLVTYPSLIEGFGNAFLEAVYYHRPVVSSMYEILKTDIQPKGFQFIPFQDFIDPNCVNQSRAILQNPDLAASMVQQNYELGRRYYSYKVLENRLAVLLEMVSNGGYCP